MAKKVTANYNEQKSIKTDYYKGYLNNKEDLEKYGFTEPWMKTSTSAGAQKYIDGDKELNTLLMRKANYEEIVKTCEYILKELNNRTWQFRNYNEYLRFTRGET